MRGSVEQQGHLAGTLDLGGESALVLGAGASDAAGDDLTAFGDEIAEDVGTLVIAPLSGEKLSSMKSVSGAEEAGDDCLRTLLFHLTTGGHRHTAPVDLLRSL